MRSAILYIRVSTDEQAERGYSQRNQEEVLRKYCEMKFINVYKVYFEDHSAKTFERPVWKRLMVDLRKNKGKADTVLFTKWDRFSRNTGDAYYMLNMLRRFGVDAQAIEQPLDLEVPENKMMLAFYLAIPEVENDRRGLNIFHGIRRAKKEGRWTGAAPVGYANRSEGGRKYIEPVEPQASAMRRAFHELATGFYSLRSIHDQAKRDGVTCGFNNFAHIIHNPVYCGKILVPAFKDEEEYLADGQHEPLISESQFFRIQALLSGNKKTNTKIITDEHYPLRGFLDCPKCGRKLTGSASRGRQHTYYYYYHCQSKCGVRFKLDDVHKFVESELKMIRLREGYEPFYTQLILAAYKKSAGMGDLSQKAIIDQIRAAQKRITDARNHFLANTLNEDDYKAVKKASETEIFRLEKILPEVIAMSRKVTIELNGQISNLKTLYNRYLSGDIEQKRRIIGCIYPENMQFSGEGHRNTRENEITYNIKLINNVLGTKKKLDNNRYFCVVQ